MDTTCNRCLDCSKLGMPFCGFCRKELGSPHEIELKRILEITNFTKKKFHHSVGNNAQVWNGMYNMSVYKIHSSSATLNDFENMNSEFKDYIRAYYKLKPFTELISNKIEKITQGDIGEIILTSDAKISFVEDEYNKKELLNKFKVVNSNLFIANTMFTANVKGQCEYNEIVVFITEKELEDKLEFLRGKNWVLPESRINFDGYGLNNHKFYSLTKFLLIYEDAITNWWSQKKIEPICDNKE